MSNNFRLEEPLWDWIILEPVEIVKSVLILQDDNKSKSPRFNFRAISCGPDVKTVRPGQLILNSMPIGKCLFGGKEVYAVRERDVIVPATEVQP